MFLLKNYHRISYLTKILVTTIYGEVDGVGGGGSPPFKGQEMWQNAFMTFIIPIGGQKLLYSVFETKRFCSHVLSQSPCPLRSSSNFIIVPMVM